MPTTRGGLAPARVSKDGGSPYVDCMFNPSEYSLSKTNSMSTGNATGTTTPDRRFQQGQPRSMTLKLYFDTYQDGPAADPVTKYTDTLFYLMSVEANDNKEPPTVEFKWGTFIFKGWIQSLKVNFTLFDIHGSPVRATADITMTEKPGDAPTPGSNWTGTTVRKTADSSVIGVVAQFTDPSNYRAVAAANNIDNPLKVKNGTVVKISADISIPPPPPIPAPPSISISASVSIRRP